MRSFFFLIENWILSMRDCALSTPSPSASSTRNTKSWTTKYHLIQHLPVSEVNEVLRKTSVARVCICVSVCLVSDVCVEASKRKVLKPNAGRSSYKQGKQKLRIMPEKLLISHSLDLLWASFFKWLPTAPQSGHCFTPSSQSCLMSVRSYWKLDVRHNVFTMTAVITWLFLVRREQLTGSSVDTVFPLQIYSMGICIDNILSLSFVAGEEKGRCFTIEYVMPTNVQMTSESTVSVLSK